MSQHFEILIHSAAKLEYMIPLFKPQQKSKAKINIVSNN